MPKDANDQTQPADMAELFHQILDKVSPEQLQALMLQVVEGRRAVGQISDETYQEFINLTPQEVVDTVKTVLAAPETPEITPALMLSIQAEQIRKGNPFYRDLYRGYLPPGVDVTGEEIATFLEQHAHELGDQFSLDMPLSIGAQVPGMKSWILEADSDDERRTRHRSFFDYVKGLGFMTALSVERQQAVRNMAASEVLEFWTGVRITGDDQMANLLSLTLQAATATPAVSTSQTTSAVQAPTINAQVLASAFSHWSSSVTEEHVIEQLNEAEYQLSLIERSQAIALFGDKGRSARQKVQQLREWLATMQGGELDRFGLRNCSKVELEHRAGDVESEIADLGKRLSTSRNVTTKPGALQEVSQILLRNPIPYLIFVKKRLLSEMRLRAKLPERPAPEKPAPIVIMPSLTEKLEAELREHLESELKVNEICKVYERRHPDQSELINRLRRRYIEQLRDPT